MNRNVGLLAASAALAVTLGGCAEFFPQPMMAQLRYTCPSGYFLGYDYMCHAQAAPPPASYTTASASDDDAPASQPASPAAASAPTWAHDLKTAGEGAAIGALAGNQLAKRGATVAGEGAAAGMIARGAGGAAADGAVIGAGEGTATAIAGPALEDAVADGLLLEVLDVLIFIP